MIRYYLIIFALLLHLPMIGQTKSCEELLDSELYFGQEELFYKQVEAMKECGYDLSETDLAILPIALTELLTESEIPTFRNIFDEIKKIKESDEFKSASKDSIVIWVSKLIIGLLIICVIGYWLRIAILQLKKRPVKNAEILDKMDED